MQEKTELEQKLERNKLVPTIQCIKEVFNSTKKLRFFFGLFGLVCTILLFTYSYNAILGMVINLILIGVSIYFAKQENDYISHLKNVYGVA